MNSCAQTVEKRCPASGGLAAVARLNTSELPVLSIPIVIIHELHLNAARGHLRSDGTRAQSKLRERNLSEHSVTFVCPDESYGGLRDVCPNFAFTLCRIRFSRAGFGARTYLYVSTCLDSRGTLQIMASFELCYQLTLRAWQLSVR